MNELAPKEKIRNTNIELLRILSMVLIVAHHYAMHGGFMFDSSVVYLKRFFIQILSFGGKLGVNCFVLISGYFLISMTAVKMSKLVRLWLKLFLYSISIVVIFSTLKIIPFNFSTVIKAALPVTFNVWWFASTYFIIFLLAPYINKLLHALDKESHFKLICLLLVLWCIIPTFTQSLNQSNQLVWFFTLYIIAGYIKLYPNRITLNCRLNLGLSAGLFGFIFLSILVIDFLGTKWSFLAAYSTYFTSMQTIPLVALSICLFLGFKNLKIKNFKIINVIATATFGVYLLHDSELVRSVLWVQLFKTASYTNSRLLYLNAFFAIAMVYLVCTAIDLLYTYTIERAAVKYITKHEYKIMQVVHKPKKKILDWHHKL